MKRTKIDLKALVLSQGFVPLTKDQEGMLAGGFVALSSGTSNNCNCNTLTNNCMCNGNNCSCPAERTNVNCTCRGDNCDCYFTSAMPSTTPSATTGDGAKGFSFLW